MITIWYTIGENLGTSLGFDLSSKDQVIGLGHFITSEFLWFDLFYLIGTLIFTLPGVDIIPIFGKTGQSWVQHY